MLGSGRGSAVNDTALYALAYLMSNYGLSREQAAGVIGNFQQESYRDLQTSVRGDGGNAVGIAQWWPDRAGNLQNFAAAQGRDWTDLDTQLDFAMHEMGITDRFGRGHGYGNEASAGRALLNAGTLRDATRAVAGYERARGYSPSNPEGIHGWSNRFANAQALYGTNATSRGLPAGRDGGGGGGNLFAGLSNNDVRALQQELTDLGYNPRSNIDGIMGPKTEAAFYAYLQDQGSGGRPPNQTFAYDRGRNDQTALAYAPTPRSRSDALDAINEQGQRGRGHSADRQTYLDQYVRTMAGQDDDEERGGLFGRIGTGIGNAFRFADVNAERLASAGRFAQQGGILGTLVNAAQRGAGLLGNAVNAGARGMGGIGAFLGQDPVSMLGLGGGLVGMQERSTPGGQAYSTGYTAPQVGLLGLFGGGDPVTTYTTPSGSTYSWYTGAAPASTGYGGLDPHEYGQANNPAYTGSTQPGGGLIGLLGSLFS